MTYNKFRLLAGATAVVAMVCASVPARAENISVQGNTRVDAETVRSYFPSGSKLTAAEINKAVQDLKSTGQFSDVRASRTASGVVVRVVENNTIGAVQFKGNSKLKSDVLVTEIRAKAGTPYNAAFVESDVARIKELYTRGGRLNAKVSSEVVTGKDGRPEVIYNIDEGNRVGINSIKFEGNKAYSQGRIRDQMTTTESNWLSFIKSSDIYDPDRVNSDLELIRRYYLRKGYADFRINNVAVNLNEERTGYDIKIALEEGERYSFGEIGVDSRVAGVDANRLRSSLETSKGSTFNAEDVEKSVEAMSLEVARMGYPFAEVRPRGQKDAQGRLVGVTYVVEPGPRLYVERINVRGNTRTRDYVVRREFDIGEGDAFNRVHISRAERRLRNTGYFKNVKVSQEQGSAPDRIVLNVDVEDQATGEFTVAGGYSTADGAIGEVGIAEKNFLGRGQYVKVSGQLGQRTQGVDFTFTEPYFLGRRMSFGVDAYSKFSDLTNYARYENRTQGGALRFGLPLTDNLTFGVNYQAYEQDVKIPLAYRDAAAANGEASLAVKDSIGKNFTSMLGYSLTYNTLDNRFSPTSGWYATFKQDFAGVGGNSKFIRTSADARYFYDLGNDFVAIGRGQAGHMIGWGGNKLKILDQYFLGPSLVRGFAPSGIGPRDISVDPQNNALGGTTYMGTSAEVQFPVLGLPKEIGMKGAVFADAGTIYDYGGKRLAGMTVWDDNMVRSSAGVGLLWSSPLGPIRFDLAKALTKGRYDRTQIFSFSGGTKF